MSYKVICALGDSITDGYWDEEGLGGWFGRLRIHLSREYPYGFGFNNLAKSGDRSTDILYKLRAEALQRTPDILLISCGINDLIRWHSPEMPTDISKDLQYEMWRQILETAKKNVGKTVVLSVQHINEAHMPEKGEFDRLLWNLNKDVEDYNERLKKWCSEHEIPFIDINATWKTLDLSGYLYDASHPNATGHQFIADRVFDALKEMGILTSP